MHWQITQSQVIILFIFSDIKTLKYFSLNQTKVISDELLEECITISLFLACVCKIQPQCLVKYGTYASHPMSYKSTK